jgi:HAD superfamily hydrolase (TIGR01509 family)
VPAPYRACLIDALGTIIRLLPPWERLDPALVAGIPAERVRDAFGAEMAYYAANAQSGRDAESLAALRERSAAVLSVGLGRPVTAAELMEAIAFEPYPDAAPALAALRERGLAICCVSNWDYELDLVLERVGLAAALDGVVTSAAVGARKPDPAIFAAALELIGRDADESIHVGDSDDDVAGARAAGIDVVRIDREGGADVSSLAEIVELVEPEQR